MQLWISGLLPPRCYAATRDALCSAKKASAPETTSFSAFIFVSCFTSLPKTASGMIVCNLPIETDQPQRGSQTICSHRMGGRSAASGCAPYQMVNPVGFEPTSLRVKAGYSAVELEVQGYSNVDLNHGPSAYQADALTRLSYPSMVDVKGIEPSTPCVSSRCSCH